MKKVSFVLPTYNSEEFLAAAVDSCLVQDYKNIEVVVVDDGSTDSTRELMKYYTEKDKRISFIRHLSNEGIASARNTGIQASSGDYIAVMDADDINAPDRITKLMRTIKDNDFAYSAYGIPQPNGQLGMVRAPLRFTKEDIINNTSIPHVTIMAKRKCFEDNSYRNALKANDDKGLLIDWYKAGYRGVRFKNPTVVVRLHANNVSKKKAKYIEQTNKELNEELK